MQERRRAKPRKTRQKIKAKITVGKKAAEKRKGKMKWNSCERKNGWKPR